MLLGTSTVVRKIRKGKRHFSPWDQDGLGFECLVVSRTLKFRGASEAMGSKFNNGAPVSQVSPFQHLPMTKLSWAAQNQIRITQIRQQLSVTHSLAYGCTVTPGWISDTMSSNMRSQTLQSAVPRRKQETHLRISPPSAAGT